MSKLIKRYPWLTALLTLAVLVAVALPAYARVRERGYFIFDKVNVKTAGNLLYAGTAITATAAELNTVADGITATAAELNTTVDGATATAAELNAVADESVNGIVRMYKISVAAGTDSGSAVDTTTDLPTQGVVLDAWIDVTAAETTASTKTLDVGFINAGESGDEDGFLDGVSCAATGTIRGVVTKTTGSNEVYYASTTKGAYLATLQAGADVATDVGSYNEHPHTLNGTAVSVVTTSAEDFTECAYTIHFLVAEW